MSSALISLILQLVGQAITEAPSLIADVERLLASAKGQAPSTPQPPLQPAVDAAMATNEQALQTPIAAPQVK